MNIFLSLNGFLHLIRFLVQVNLKGTFFLQIFEKNAPSEIQELFSRNELIQKFADKKYLLNSLELSNLLGEENHLKIKQYSLFEWRNWKLIPKDKKYWIIEKKEA